MRDVELYEILLWWLVKVPYSKAKRRGRKRKRVLERARLPPWYSLQIVQAYPAPIISSVGD
jgi:hypothetical protein